MYAVQEKHAWLQPVSVGQRSGAVAEVRDRRECDTTVILHSVSTLEDGVKVRHRSM